LLENPGSVVLDPTPPEIRPQIVSEARLGAEDLVKLGRLNAPRGSLTAFVDYDLYERITMRYSGGITKFILDAAQEHGRAGVVEILTAEKRLSDRRSGTPTTTIGARVPINHVQRVTVLNTEARRLGIPGVSKNAIVSGLVMLFAETTGILND
jgi:hypothetical protein